MLGWVGTTVYLLLPVAVWLLILKVWPGLGEPWVAFFVAWVPWTLHEVYDRWPWLNLQVKRVWLWMSNAPMQWEVRAEYAGDVAAMFRYAQEWLKKQGAKVETEGSESITLRLPDNSYVTLDVVAFPAGESDIVRELVIKTAVNMPFRSGARALGRWAALFEEVQKTTKQPAKYTFALSFQSGRNPYFGLFVHMLGGSAVKDLQFNVAFEERNGRVFVTRERVRIVTRSVSGLQSLSKRYVVLGGVPTAVL